jgi:hypothetical protein
MIQETIEINIVEEERDPFDSVILLDTRRNKSEYVFNSQQGVFFQLIQLNESELRKVQNRPSTRLNDTLF